MRLSLTVLAGLILVCAANAKDADICLSPRDVDHTRVLSDNEILYVMKSGKNWKNTLRKSCPASASNARSARPSSPTASARTGR